MRFLQRNIRCQFLAKKIYCQLSVCESTDGDDEDDRQFDGESTNKSDEENSDTECTDSNDEAMVCSLSNSMFLIRSIQD